MRFTPMSEQQCQEVNVLPAGVYDFEVVEAEDTTSKKGNAMITLSLRVFNPNGGSVMVRDWLVATDGMMYKVRHFCYAVGLDAAYEAGTLQAALCVGRSGKASIKVRDRTDDYPASNTVSDYEVADTQPAGQASAPSPTNGAHCAITEDDIPFSPDPLGGW